MRYSIQFAPFLLAAIGFSAQPAWSDPNACSDFVTYATQGKDDSSLQTDSLMVVKGGQVAYEYYDGFFKAETPHCLFSGSKSATATLLGIAVKQGRISLDQKIVDIFPESVALRPEKDSSQFKKLTIADFLYMRSGLQWREVDGLAMRDQTGLRMLYTDGALDTLSFVFKQPMSSAGPGNIWAYSSGASNVIMAALQKAYGKDDVTFPWRELFDKIGMDRTTFSRDKAGTFLGSAYVFTPLREMARLGELYLNDGVYQGERILPEGWTQVVSTRSSAVGAKATIASDITDLGVYGGGFWVNQAVPEKGMGKPYPNSPDDVYMAAGHYGQLIIVIPSQDMVIARTGHDMEFNSKVDGLISRAIQCYGTPSQGGAQ